MVDLTVINEYIKTTFVDGINDIMWKSNYLLNRIKASNYKVNPQNRTAEVRVRVGGNQGVAQSSVIPRSGKTKTITSTVQLKKGYGFLEIDGDALTYAPNGDTEMAFVGALATESQSVIESMARDIEIALMGKGDGIRGTVTAVAGNVITFDSDNPAWFELGMVIDAYTGTTLTGRYEITGTNLSANQITVSLISGAMPNVNDVLTNQRELNNTIMGFLGICDDGTELVTLQGIDSSVYELWRARVDENGGTLRAITSEMLDKMMIYGARTGGFDIIVTTEDLLYSIANLLNANRRYVNMTTLQGGWKGIEWAGKEFASDMYMRKNQIFFINSNKVELKQVKGSKNNVFNAVDWLTRGTNGDMFVTEYTEGSVEKYKALLRWDAELTTTDRKAFGRIADVQ